MDKQTEAGMKPTYEAENELEDLLSVCPEEEEFSLGNFLKKKVARGVIQGYKSWTVPHILAIIPCPDHELNWEDRKDFFVIDPALGPEMPAGLSLLEDGASQSLISCKNQDCITTVIRIRIKQDMDETELLLRNQSQHGCLC